MTIVARGRTHATDTRGFTILELVVVLALSATLLGFAGWTFSAYVHRTSAQRAAQVFARDLTLARQAAIRGRESVVIRFFEAGRWYQIATAASGDEIARRRFSGTDLSISAIDLRISGDSLVFSSAGVARLPGGSATVGEARFSSGDREYAVLFNGMGASRVEVR